MAEIMLPNGQKIRPVYSAKDVRFLVFDNVGYLFTLIPSPTGFELSQLDIELGLEIDPELVLSIEKTIEGFYA